MNAISAPIEIPTIRADQIENLIEKNSTFALLVWDEYCDESIRMLKDLAKLWPNLIGQINVTTITAEDYTNLSICNQIEIPTLILIRKGIVIIEKGCRQQIDILNNFILAFINDTQK